MKSNSNHRESSKVLKSHHNIIIMRIDKCYQSINHHHLSQLRITSGSLSTCFILGLDVIEIHSTLFHV